MKKKIDKMLNSEGFVLLETVVVAVFIIGIFTFTYISLVPLLGRYEELAYENDLDIAYKLYHIRDAMYKDDNFDTMISKKYKRITSDDFSDTTYFNSLSSSLFDNNYEIIYIRGLKTRVNSAISGLEIKGGFKDYIKRISETKTNGDIENFIFLKEGNNYAYLGLAVELGDTTNYKEPEVIDANSHTDTSGANAPLIMGGMIPVFYSEDEEMWKKADITNKSSLYYWYDYNDLMWANVVLVTENTRQKYLDANVNSEININDVIAFYVWIPRFEYVIQGTYGLNGTSKTLPGEISVNFIKNDVSKKRTVDSTTWRTASAFTFGEKELDGFWFAKFEMSNSELKGYSKNGEGVPYVLPDTYSWSGQKVAQAYSKITTYMNGTNGSSIYGLASESYESDAHVMKNEEWGAVAYLSQSKYGKYNNDNFSSGNKEIYLNNRSVSSGGSASVITGSSAGYPANNTNGAQAVTASCSNTSSNPNALCYTYNVENYGTGASTTGTIYGVYDMAGGVKEIIMGARGASSESCGSKVYVGYVSEFTGFKGPYSGITTKCNDDTNDIDFPTDSKYYTIYNGLLRVACSGVCYSHAMSETSGWYDDVAEANTATNPWYLRGGQIEVSSGIFAISAYSGSTSDENVVKAEYTTRPTISVHRNKTCEWVQVSSSSPNNCTPVPYSDNPQEGDVAVTCSDQIAGDWGYSYATMYCKTGISVPAYTSGYSYNTQAEAASACSSRQSQSITETCPYNAEPSSPSSCNTYQLKYYYKTVETYTCSE